MLGWSETGLVTGRLVACESEARYSEHALLAVIIGSAISQACVDTFQGSFPSLHHDDVIAILRLDRLFGVLPNFNFQGSLPEILRVPKTQSAQSCIATVVIPVTVWGGSEVCSEVCLYGCEV
eukprot:3866250-Pyramimonas_sp.AAC.2